MARERQHEWLDEGEAKPCPSCKGVRLNEIARNVRLQSRTIDQFAGLPVRALASKVVICAHLVLSLPTT